MVLVSWIAVSTPFTAGVIDVEASPMESLYDVDGLSCTSPASAGASFSGVMTTSAIVPAISNASPVSVNFALLTETRFDFVAIVFHFFIYEMK
jgi:hypothetical protein